MNKLQEKYGNRTGECSLQIFGFPCNQFGYQEPAENFELLSCVKHVRPGFGFVPAFPLAKKGDVNGIFEQPIYTFLKARCPAPMGLIANRSDITWQPIRNNDISWNFQKWLINHDGQPSKRFTSRTTPEMVEQDIVLLLEKCKGATMGGAGDNTSTTPIPPPQNLNGTSPRPMAPSGEAPPQPPLGPVAAPQQPQPQPINAQQIVQPEAPKAKQMKRRSFLFN